METRGIRGAITVDSNTKEEIIGKTQALLSAMLKENRVPVEEIVSIIFSLTADLDAEFPARAAREMGWTYVPLLCTNEANVKDGLAMCVRALMTVNSDLPQREIKHIYLEGAKVLRKDFLS